MNTVQFVSYITCTVQNDLYQNALLPVFFNFCLEDVIGNIREDQKELKLNGTHQLLCYIVDVNLKSESSCLVT
jgi:hypothetical protein